jgi:hypothetical protein
MSRQHSEGYETDTPEEYLARCEAMVRAIYYCYRDSTEKGCTDHDSLKMYVDSLIYNSLKAEEKIKANSKNIQTNRPKISNYNELRASIRLKEEFDRYYDNLREKAKARINENQ